MKTSIVLAVLLITCYASPIFAEDTEAPEAFEVTDEIEELITATDPSEEILEVIKEEEETLASTQEPETDAPTDAPTTKATPEPTTQPPTPTATEPTKAPSTPKPNFNACNCTVGTGLIRKNIPSNVLFQDTDIGFTSTEECSKDFNAKCDAHCLKQFRIYTLGFDLTSRPLAPKDSEDTLGERICSIVRTKLISRATLRAVVKCDVNDDTLTSTRPSHFSKVLMRSKQPFSCLNGKAYVSGISL